MEGLHRFLNDPGSPSPSLTSMCMIVESPLSWRGEERRGEREREREREHGGEAKKFYVGFFLKTLVYTCW